MRHIKSGLAWAILFFSIGIANICMAAGSVEIVKAEGSLTVSDAAGLNQKSAKTKDKLPHSNILTTGTNGRAIVRVGSTGFIVLEKNSQIEINTENDHANFFRHITGMIYYAVNRINKNDNTLEIRTKTATIGIRGTRFMVTDMPARYEVAMRKGVLNILSPQEEFEIHKISEQDEFEASKQAAQEAMAAEKDQFKKFKKDTQHEFIEYKREFTLETGRMVSFDGKRADDRPLSDAAQKDMETLESYADKWLAKVHD